MRVKIVSKRKHLSNKNLPLRTNILLPFLVYMFFDFYTLPMWGFAIYMTLWVIAFIVVLITNISAEQVELKD